MKLLILYPTDLSQWHALVNEAQAVTQLILTESTESYLVFLLMRYAQKPNLIESIIALDFLSLEKKSDKIDKLQEIGDKSLLFCGLFPGIAQKRRVSIEYFVELGRGAYANLANMHNFSKGEIFAQLSQHFLHLQQILQALRTV